MHVDVIVSEWGHYLTDVDIDLYFVTIFQFSTDAQCPVICRYPTICNQVKASSEHLLETNVQSNPKGSRIDVN